MGARRLHVAAPAGPIHAIEAGDPAAPPVLLLHGFPEFWWSWRHQIPALVAAGFRAVAPDLRGYHRSAKPRGLGPYRLDRLAEDVGALLDAAGPGPHPVVGHDWGGALAWWSALSFPGRIARLAILNAPHPVVFRRALVRDRAQRRRSRYFFSFLLPWLPERKLSANGFRVLKAMFRRTSREGTFSDDDLDRYAAALAVPGALRGALAWYRAALLRPAPRLESPVVEPPVQIQWGVRDAALGEPLLDATAALCRSVEVHRHPEATHWVQHEEPERVNELLLAFLAR